MEKGPMKDMYLFSMRNRRTDLCLLYAIRQARRKFGPTALHKHDERCDHSSACELCKFSQAIGDETVLMQYCFIAMAVEEGFTFTEAYSLAREILRENTK